MACWMLALCAALVAAALFPPAAARQPAFDFQFPSVDAFSGASECPPPGFDAVPVNLTQFVAAPWYVQMQEPVLYQPEAELYCVRALYKPEDPAKLEEGLDVLNYANRGAVNGPAVGSGINGSAFKMYAVPEFPGSASASGKLLVGPGIPLSQRALGMFQPGQGEYWIVALGSQNANSTQFPNAPTTNSTNGYDWAIVSAGAPKRASNGACSTGLRDGAYDSGLWLFSRKPEDPVNTAVMKQKAQDLGFDTSVLRNVTQAGCHYAGAAN